MLKIQKDVLKFHKDMGLPVSTEPTMLSEAAANRRIRLMDEELDEFIEAYEADDLVGMADALADLMYVTVGTANEMGINLEPIWNEVQRSNMTKRGGYLNEYGKYIKPENYSPADVARVLEDEEAGIKWGMEWALAESEGC